MEFGSGSALLGGTDALNAAIAARQTGQAGATQQVSGAAPTNDPTAQGPQPSALSPQSGGSQPVASATQAPTTPTAPFDPAEIKTILNAMNGRMKTIGRLSGDIKA